MKRVKIVLIVVFGMVFLIGFIFILFNLLKPKVAGIYIESIPAATVYINGEEDGRTPYDKKDKKPGEYIVQLVPDSFETPLVPYETKTNLVAGVQTVIKHNFAETEDASNGEIISFEKIDKNQVSLAVVTIPDSVELIIDESERAFTPHRTTALLPGTHTMTLKAEGFYDKQVNVRTHQGYKLTAVIKLAKVRDNGMGDEASNESEDKEGVETPKKVKILPTPVGFLRVRHEPSTLAGEIGTVEPEKEYEVVEIDEETGWFKIKFEEKRTNEELEGWISDQYAVIIESVSTTPSVTIKPAS